MWDKLLQIIGVGIAFFVSRYYYRRSVVKELTPFLLFKSNILDHIDDEVKSNLKIEYNGIKVERLQQILFVIANTGERAIKEQIKPLELKISGKLEIIDAGIVYVHPCGREVKLNVDKKVDNKVEFNFCLLNKDDFFVVKLLINGAPQKLDYRFSITAEDLPPELDVRRLYYDQIGQEGIVYKEKVGFDINYFLIGVGFIILSACIEISLRYSTEIAIPEIKVAMWSWLNVIPIVSIARFGGYVVSLLLVAIGIIAMRAALVIKQRPKNKKFILPRELARPRYSRDLEEMFDSVDEDFKEKKDKQKRINIK